MPLNKGIKPNLHTQTPTSTVLLINKNISEKKLIFFKTRILLFPVEHYVIKLDIIRTLLILPNSSALKFCKQK